MNRKAEDIRFNCYLMKEGQCLRIHRSDFNDAFGPMCRDFSIYHTPEQAFLSGMVGAGCGTFRVKQDLITGDVTVSRHPESNKRYYVDPDREHLFQRLADGTLERKKP